jgi:peptide/nickel transport system ATP-binding protein
MQDVLLDVRGLFCSYKVGSGGWGRARLREVVSDVSLQVRAGETLGVVGESGSGKSTMARGIMQSPRPVRGEVLLHGENLVPLRGQELRSARRRMGFVFQDPYSSLNPVWEVEKLVGEPLAVTGDVERGARSAMVADLLEQVGLNPVRDTKRRIRDFSGGQSQRVAIARALASSPDLLICDEPVSALDVSIQAQVLKLFEELKSARGLAYLFISHDLTVVEYISDRVAVLYLGRLCEVAPTADLYGEAQHPYTRALLSASPRRHGKETGHDRMLAGDVPALEDVAGGCRFRTRCPLAERRCEEETPELRLVGPSHWVACHVA